MTYTVLHGTECLCTDISFSFSLRTSAAGRMFQDTIEFIPMSDALSALGLIAENGLSSAAP